MNLARVAIHKNKHHHIAKPLADNAAIGLDAITLHNIQSTNAMDPPREPIPRHRERSAAIHHPTTERRQ